MHVSGIFNIIFYFIMCVKSTVKQLKMLLNYFSIYENKTDLL